MNQPQLQQQKLQKQMTTASQPPFTIDDVIAQQGILATAQVTAFGHAGQYITDLKAQIAAGKPVTQTQLDQLGNQFVAMTTATQAFDVTNTEPVLPIPPPVPTA